MLFHQYALPVTSNASEANLNMTKFQVITLQKQSICRGLFMQLLHHPSDFYATVNLQKYKILHKTCTGYEGLRHSIV
jgi:hypothetical protein